tara:strand:- start:174 stop:404 length:231 start_codon:yes stop_codon:yes gene_type:complete
MRQAGMKPKSHSSGVYWVRANANTGGGGKKTEAHDPNDFNNDGVVSKWESLVRPIGYIAGVIVALFLIIVSLGSKP